VAKKHKGGQGRRRAPGQEVRRRQRRGPRLRPAGERARAGTPRLAGRAPDISGRRLRRDLPKLKAVGTLLAEMIERAEREAS
jgi:hypothetical protein